MTQGVRGILDDKVKEQEVKLVSKINRSINKKKDKLRLSVRELVDSEWSKFAEDYLPKELPNIDSPNAKPVDGQNKKAADSKQPK